MPNNQPHTTNGQYMEELTNNGPDQSVGVCPPNSNSLVKSHKIFQSTSGFDKKMTRLIAGTLVFFLAACGNDITKDTNLEEPLASAVRAAGWIQYDSDRSDALIAAAEAAFAHQASADTERLLNYASQAALRIETTRRRSRTLGNIAKFYIRLGNVHAAEQLLEKTDSFTEESYIAVVDVVEVLLDQENLQAAQEILSSTINRTVTLEPAAKAIGLRILAGGYLHLGNRERALELLKEAFDITQKHEYPSLSGAERGWIAIRFAEADSPVQAGQIIRQVEPLSERATYLLWLGRAHIQKGSIEHAIELLDAFDIPTNDNIAGNRLASMRQHLAKDIAEALARAGEIETAVEMMNQVTVRSVQAQGLAVIAAQAGIHHGQDPIAQNLLDEMLQIAHSLTPYTASLRLIDAARAAKEAGDTAEAQRLLEMAENRSLEVTVYRQRNVNAARLASMYLALDALNDVRRVANRLPAKSTTRDRILGDLIEKQASRGQISEALETADDLYYERNKARALAAVTGAYPAIGRIATDEEITAIIELERKIYRKSFRHRATGWLRFLN